MECLLALEGAFYSNSRITTNHRLRNPAFHFLNPGHNNSWCESRPISHKFIPVEGTQHLGQRAPAATESRTETLTSPPKKNSNSPLNNKLLPVPLHAPTSRCTSHRYHRHHQDPIVHLLAPCPPSAPRPTNCASLRILRVDLRALIRLPIVPPFQSLHEVANPDQPTYPILEAPEFLQHLNRVLG
jgi:hypothetical protein